MTSQVARYGPQAGCATMDICTALRSTYRTLGKVRLRVCCGLATVTGTEPCVAACGPVRDCSLGWYLTTGHAYTDVNSVVNDVCAVFIRTSVVL
ncbi:hypothetical protein BaRGS_00008385 [Batillaria attramentaria]|uniref:Uncharacterized protein n=1 Tax=Batillaria attramentaria TaxID=370345 RepID=A0ABD0LNB7_9CAEN